MTQNYILSEVSFIGGALLAAGSFVSDDDLGTYVDPATGDTLQVKAGRALIPVDDEGQPINKAHYAALQGLRASLSTVSTAAVAPFSPEAFKAQSAPAQPPGGVALAEGDLGRTHIAGTDAAKRLAQATENARATMAIGGTRPAPEAPTRRSGERGGTKKAARAAPKARAAAPAAGQGSGAGENGAG